MVPSPPPPSLRVPPLTIRLAGGFISFSGLRGGRFSLIVQGQERTVLMYRVCPA